jgi:hypothetical protein
MLPRELQRRARRGLCDYTHDTISRSCAAACALQAAGRMRNLIATLFIALSLTACGAPEPQDEQSNALGCANCVFGCQTNAECSAGNYCKKPDGQCGGYGYCDTQPSNELCYVWPGTPRACGCDGHTYYTACFATKAGVNVAHSGPCR